MPHLTLHTSAQPEDPCPDRGLQAPARKLSRRHRIPLLVRRKQAASLCSVGQATWDRWSAAGLNPKSLKIGGAVFWDRAELAAWVRYGCPARAEWSAIWATLLKDRNRK